MGELKQRGKANLNERWGEPVLEAGFLLLPALLLKKQAALELSDGEMVTLLNLLAAWWEDDDFPYLGAPQLSHRLGISLRTARRHLRNLQKKQMIRALPNTVSNHDPDTLVTRYDLSPVVAILQDHAVSVRAKESGKRTRTIRKTAELSA